MSPSRLTCAETFARLDDYVDRELAPDEVREVVAHLESCVVCAGEFEIERRLLDDIRGKLRRVRAPADLMAKVSSRLRAE
jgi:anti-sigma factor (TIGR02949 family)